MSARAGVCSVIMLAACSRTIAGANEASSESDSTTSASASSIDSESDSETASESGPGCAAFELECPDGTCVASTDDDACCEHGGACPPSPCAAQDASSGADSCDVPAYAWDGAYCREVCACVGSDCGGLFETPRACLAAHASCGDGFDLSDCRFDELVAPVEVSGVVLGEPVELTAGAFGDYLDEMGNPGIQLHLAPDTLALGNYVITDWMLLDQWGVIVVGPAPIETGVHVVPVHIAGTQTFADASLTITEIDDGPDLAARVLVGDVLIDQDGWTLAGSFGVRYCPGLDSKF